jgi:hypothetical protein
MKWLACSTPSCDSLPVAPWEALTVDTSNGYHLLQDAMAAPLGALSAGSAASTTEFKDVVDGGPPRGRCQRVRQRPPPSFDDVDGGPLRGGGAAAGSDSVHHRG